jgi:DNA-binding response OmpR family regulator
MARETVLILDKEENAQWTLKTLLEMENYAVVTVGTADQAMKDFSEFKVSGLITDYWVARGSTLMVLKELKKKAPESYAMVLTDRELTEEEYEEVFSSGADDCFCKPVPIKRILLHLRKGLRRRGVLLRLRLLKEKAARAKALRPVGESRAAEASSAALPASV